MNLCLLREVLTGLHLMGPLLLFNQEIRLSFSNQIDLILDKINKNTLKKETLAGCVIKKVNHTVIITKEY